MKRISIVIVLIVLAAAGGWWIGQRGPHSARSGSTDGHGKPLFYQSPMHPWVTSPTPGRCTVCGMELVPVYESGPQAKPAESGVVMLPPGSPAVAGIETSVVTRRPLERALRVSGVIEDNASRHRILSAYVPGRIDRLAVNQPGAEVVEGQLLATFFSRPLLTAIGEYRLIGKTGAPETRRASIRRLQLLGLTPAQIAALDRSPATGESTVEILSPMSGTVVQQYVYEGQYVKEGDKLFELADFAKMWFIFFAYERDLPWLQTGQSVTVTVPAHPGRTWQAPIQFIDPNLDPTTRSARVRVELDNPERLLRHRLYAEATVDVGAPDVLALPRSAVLWPGSDPRVYVQRQPGEYELRLVKLGRAGDTDWEVLDGVSAGDVVITTGNVLVDGQAQLTGLAQATRPPPRESPGAPPIMDVETRNAAHRYLTAASAVSAALAGDDPAAYQAALKALPEPPPPGVKVGPPAATADLAEARKSFLPWSHALAAFVAQQPELFSDIRVFQCPMTDDLWKGAPPNARWIQNSAELRNPYFGAAMLECGVEVKP